MKKKVIDLQIVAAKLTDKECFCLTAYLYDPTPDNKSLAFLCSRKKPTSYDSENVLYSSVSRWFNSDAVRAYITLESDKKKALLRATSGQSVESDNVTKEELLASLSILFRAEKDAKLKAELGLKIADLEKFKHEVKFEEDKIHYFLPLRCSKCKLYKDAQRRI